MVAKETYPAMSSDLMRRILRHACELILFHGVDRPESSYHGNIYPLHPPRDKRHAIDEHSCEETKKRGRVLNDDQCSEILLNYGNVVVIPNEWFAVWGIT